MKTPQPRYVVAGDWWRCPQGKFHRVALSYPRTRRNQVGDAVPEEAIQASCGATFPSVFGREVWHADDAEPGDGAVCWDCARAAGSQPPAHLAQVSA
jgi:hypothetical protein